MAIFVNEHTKVIVQGLTGGQGRFHGLRNRDYGTRIVAGVTPGKGGQEVPTPDGQSIPVFDSVAEAVAATGATASSWQSDARRLPSQERLRPRKFKVNAPSTSYR